MTSFSSIAQCSSLTGIPAGILRGSKRQGCPAFRDSKVYLLEFLEWYFKQQHGDVIDINVEKGRIAAAEARRLERENSVAEGELHSIKDVEKQVWSDLLQPLRVELLAMPSALASRCSDPDSAREAIQNYIDDMLRKIKKGK